MGEAILITGVAGTGKSAVCKELRKLGYKAYDIEVMEDLFTMIDKETGKPFYDYDNDDLEKVKRAEWICDKKRLQRLILRNWRRTVFYCGVASNTDELLPLFDRIFLLKASPDILRKRLSTRTSNDFGRTHEVQEWMFSWKDWWEEHMESKGAIPVNADQPPRDVVNEILEKLGQKKGRRDGKQ